MPARRSPVVAALAAASLTAAALTGAAWAGPTYTRQSRYVSADVAAPGESRREASAFDDFDPFLGHAAVVYRNPQPPPFDDGAAAGAVQRSVLSPDGIAFSGTVRAESLASTDDDRASTGIPGEAASYLQVVFDLDAPYRYDLTADTDGGAGGDPATMCWMLERLDVLSPDLTALITLEDDGLTGGVPQSRALTGALSAGTYRLTTAAMAETALGTSALDYRIELGLTAAGDPSAPVPPATVPLPSGLGGALLILLAVAARSLFPRRRLSR